MFGFEGDDMLDGAGGDDRVFGGTGDDRLAGGDGDGDDRVDGGTGNDQVFGDTGDDALFGRAGDDSLFGGTGNDRLLGEEGNDFLRGDEGIDRMTSGAGSDTFVFLQVGDDYDSGVGAGNRDAITDFASAEGDKIDVTLIDADRGNGTFDEFVFAGEADIGSLDTTEIGFFETGGVTIVHANTGADPGSSFEIQLRGTGHDLSADDFIL